MANICINCKADLREGAKFCQVCGTKVPVKQKSKIAQAKFCIKCGAPLKKGAKFCTNCGTPTSKQQRADLDILVDEPVVSVTVSDQPPIIREAPVEKKRTRQIQHPKNPYRDTDVQKEKRGKDTKYQIEDKIKKQAVDLGKKALSQLLNQTLSASDTAGEMRIPMNDAQKSCLSDVIRQLTKIARR